GHQQAGGVNRQPVMSSTDLALSSEPAAVASSRPTWRMVLALALPVLGQQLCILSVSLSDRYLAGAYQPTATHEPQAYQAAQTTANYLAWCITSYTVLVSVGGTALVARFTGAGDRASATHVTNQSLLLAVFFGLLGSITGLVGLDGIVWLLQVRGDAAVFAVDYLRP